MFDAPAAHFACFVLLQSTLLIAVGLFAARWCSGRRAVIESAILRVTLVAVLLCPLASLMFKGLGVSGVALLPAWDTPGEAGTAGLLKDERTLAVERTTRPLDRVAFDPAPSDGELAIAPLARVRSESNGITTPGAPLASAADAGLTGLAEPPAEAVPTLSRAASAMPLVNSMVAWVWLVGAALLLGRMLVANVVIARLRRSSCAAGPEIVELCQRTAHTLGLRAPDIRVSPHVHSPCLVGMKKPVILLPDETPFTPGAMRDVLLHELAHLSRWDCLFHFISQMARAVLFFQPLVWVLSRRLEQTADDVCDDYVIQFGTDRKGYAHALVDLAEALRPQWATASAGLGVMSLKSSLSRRVHRILDSSRSLTLRLKTGWVVVIVALGMSATATAALVLTESDESAATQKSEATPQSRTFAADTSTDVSQEADAGAGSATTSAAPADAALQPFRLQGRVLDPQGNPVTGAKISLFQWQLPADSVLAKTNEQGEFDYEIAPSDKLYARLAEDSGIVIATADGFGLAARPLHECETSGALVAAFQRRSGSEQSLPVAHDPVFQLVPDDLPVSGRVVDIQGQPVANAKVRVCKVATTGTERLNEWEDAARQPNADYYSLQRFAGGGLGGDVGGATLNCIPPAVTDEKGQFVLRGIGRDRIVKLLISGPGIETNEVHARTRNGDDIEISEEPRNPAMGTILYHPASFTHVAGPSQAVEGLVRDAKSGQPLGGVTIQSFQLAGRRTVGWTQSLVQAVSDADGHYRLEGLPLGENQVLALSSRDEPYIVAAFPVKTGPGEAPVVLDIELTRGIWIHGRAYDVSTSEPIQSGRVDYYAFTSNPYAQAVRGFNGAFLSTRYRLNPDGTYRIPGLPGRGIVTVMADRDHEKYRRGQGADAIEGMEPNLKGFITYPTILSAFNGHVLVEVNPTEQQQEVEVDLPFDPGRTLTVQVVDDQGEPVTSGLFTGMMEHNSWRPMNGDRLELHSYQPDKPRRVQVIDQEHKLAGFLLVTGEAPRDLTVILEPWAEIHGRLLDSAGVPKANAELRDVYRIISDNPDVAVLPPGENSVAILFTDDDGRFSFAGLAPHRKYTLFASDVRKDGRYSLGEIPLDFTLEPGEVRDLGDVRLPERGAQ